MDFLSSLFAYDVGERSMEKLLITPKWRKVVSKM